MLLTSLVTRWAGGSRVRRCFEAERRARCRHPSVLSTACALGTSTIFAIPADGALCGAHIALTPPPLSEEI